MSVVVLEARPPRKTERRTSSGGFFFLSLVNASNGRTRTNAPSITMVPCSTNLLASAIDPTQTCGEYHLWILGLLSTVSPDSTTCDEVNSSSNALANPQETPFETKFIAVLSYPGRPQWQHAAGHHAPPPCHEALSGPRGTKLVH